MFWPLIGLDRSDARNRITSATSAGVISARAPPLTAAHIGVSTDPGLTQLTRMPCSFSSTASDSVKEISAALLEQYAEKPGNFCGPITPLIEETLTIVPLRLPIIALAARRDVRNAPRTLTAKTRSQSRLVMRSMRLST